MPFFSHTLASMPDSTLIFHRLGHVTMDKRSFPTLNQNRWTISAKDIESRVGGILDSADFHTSAESSKRGTAAVGEPKISKPISSMMDHHLWTVDADDTIEKVEESMSGNQSRSVPVMGSNGAIIGIIGSREIAHFHFENGNSKVVRAWEISRCTMFEVSPDDSVENVSKLMTRNKIEYIAVTKFGALKGVVSALALLQAILQENADDAIARNANH